MSDFDSSREAALKLALQHHANGSEAASKVVETARVFLDFLISNTQSDREWLEKIASIPVPDRPLD